MKTFLAVSLVCIFSGFMLIACQREQGVQAGREEGRTDTYPPLPTPATEPRAEQEIKGELSRIDMGNKTMVIRTENGMEQTMKFNDATMVTGLEVARDKTTRGKEAATMQVRDLVGKEGSEVTIKWRDEAGNKVITSIEVTQVATKAPTKNKAKGTRY